MNGTHTLAEWAAMVDIAVSGYASFSTFWFLFVDAKPSDFDPRPAVSRAVESGEWDRLLVAVSNAKTDACAAADRVRTLPRDAAISLAALLMLLSPSAPEATR